MAYLPQLPSTWSHKREAFFSALAGVAALGFMVWVLGTVRAVGLFWRQPVLSHLVSIAFILIGMILVHSRFCDICARIRNNEKGLDHPPFTFLHGIRAATPFVLFGILLLSIPSILNHPLLLPVDRFQITFPLFVVVVFLIWEFIAWNGWWGGPKKPVGKKAKPPINELADYPITQDKQDLLDRTRLADRLVEEIKNQKSIESIVYGIYGGWGEGKSSLLNMVANRLKQEPSVLPVFFNPWFLEGGEALIRNFYSTLDEAVNQEYYLPRFHKKISKYRSVLLTGSAWSGIHLTHLLPQDDLFSLRKGIEETLGAFGKKLVVIIDEMDRLSPSEIQTVFSIVKQSAKFRYTVFLLGFDPDKIRQILKSEVDPDFRLLEKIVQKPITLPPSSKETVFQYLDRNLDNLFKELGIFSGKQELFRDRFVEFWNSTLRHYLVTLRSIKRLVSGLRANLPSIHKEVDLFDFVLVEILRVFFYRAYLDIQNSYWFYIRTTNIADGLTDLMEFGRDEKQKVKKIRAHFQEVLEKESSPASLKKIVIQLFPWMGEPGDTDYALPSLNDVDRGSMRVRHPGSFHRYFYLTVDEFPLDSEVEDLIQRANSLKADQAIQHVLSELTDAKTEGHLEGLLQKIEMFETLLTDDGRKVISWGIAHNTRQYDKRTPSGWKPTEYEQALKLVHRLVMNVERTQMRHLLISDLIRNSPDTYFVVRLVNSLVGSPEGFDEEDVRSQASARLRRRYLLDKHSMFEDFSNDPVRVEVIWAWGTNFGSEDNSNIGDLNVYFLDLMGSNPKKIVPFLKLFRSGEKFSYDRLERLFQPDKIYQLAIEHRFDITEKPEHAALVEEFLEAYDSRQEPKEPTVEQID